MKKKRKLIGEKSSSLPNLNSTGSKNSLSDIVKARELLPIIEISRSETVLSDGTIVKSLFLDYFSDREYLIAKLIKRVKQQYEKEVKEFETLSAGGAEKTSVKKLQPSWPFLGYN